MATVKTKPAKKRPAKKATDPVPVVRKQRTDRYFYDKIQALHDEAKEEMRRRQVAGERWRALFPVIQRLFIVLRGLKYFIPK